jgi:hypothetical protein
MSEAIQKSYNKMVDSVKNSINLKKAKLVQLGVFLVGTLMVLLLFIWSYTKLTLSRSNCSNIEKNKLDATELKRYDYDKTQEPVDNVDKTYGDYRLRDFYVKTAYNCCASGSFSHDFVNECAIENCIQLGARCLDFEVYSFDDNPIISVSTDKNFWVKETYNYLEFDRIMAKIRDMAFTTGKNNAGNLSSDPLILHFRIKTEHKNILDSMADSLNKNFYDRLLSRRYSYQYNGKDLGNVEMKYLQKKVIIIVNNVGPLNIEETKLYEYINIVSGGENMRLMRYKEATLTGVLDEIRDYNKGNMSICIPDLNARPENMDWSQLMHKMIQGNKYDETLKLDVPAIIPYGYGIQFVGMSFQSPSGRIDPLLKTYIDEFNRHKSSFILKPKEFRKDTPQTTIEINTDKINKKFAEDEVTKEIYALFSGN